MNKMYMQFDGNEGFLTYSLKAYDPGIHWILLPTYKKDKKKIYKKKHPLLKKMRVNEGIFSKKNYFLNLTNFS